MSRAPARAGSLPQVEQNRCVLCDVPMRNCWLFQEDDCACSLCGKRILSQHVGQGHAGEDGTVSAAITRPPADDGRLLLYMPPSGEMLLCVTWARGVANKQREAVAPPLDLGKCEARFAGQLGFMNFRWGEPVRRSRFTVVGLRPEQSIVLPAGGLGGKVRVASPPLERDHKAVLYPWPDFACRCTERTAGEGGVLQVNQALRVPLEMGRPLAASTAGLRIAHLLTAESVCIIAVDYISFVPFLSILALLAHRMRKPSPEKER